MARWPDVMTDDNTPQRQCRPKVKTSLQAKEASDANTLLDCIAKLTIPCASQVILKENLVFFYSENKYVSIHGGLETERKTYEKLCDILRSGTQIWHSQKFPENSLRFCCFLKFPEELDKFPEISLIFHGKAISLSFSESVGTLN